MAYLITSDYTPAIISEWKHFNFMCMEKSEGKNVP